MSRLVALLTASFTTLAVAAHEGRSPSPLQPDVAASYRAELIGTWIEAVLGHAPGQDDDGIRVLRTWRSHEDIRDAWVTINVLIALLDDPNRQWFSVPLGRAKVPVDTGSGLKLMAARARALQERPGRDAFLKRAALLHSDAAMLIGPSNVQAPFDTSFLLPRRVFATTGDGTQEGLRGGDVSWEFSRILLDGVTRVQKDHDVEAWYEATMSYLLSQEHYDSPHFEHAQRLFPQSPRIRHLVGCLHEALAEPRVQSVLRDIRVPPRTTLQVRPERAELSEAEAHFRAALEQAPQHHEARLRRGRTLGRLGRHEEAASELRSALDGIDEPVMRYYATLFLGAEEEAIGRFERASSMYAQAAALFPRAQAPPKALSQLAHRRGDRMAARTLLEPALKERDRETDDPWWTYHLSCSRDADARIAAVYQSIYGASR